MKRFAGFVLAAALLCVALSGCVMLPFGQADNEESVTWDIKGYDMQLTTGDSWEEYEQESSFDLQLIRDNVVFSVMVYHTVDLAEDSTPASVYEWQNEDLFSKRDNVQPVESYDSLTVDGRTITHRLYSAENDGNKFYYYSCLIEMADGENFAWVLVTGIPSKILEQQEELLEMIKTLDRVPDKALA